MKTGYTIIALVIAATFFISASKAPESNTTSINFFHGTYKQALAEAKKQNKLVFIDAYASWCGPCKLLAQNTFTDKNVGEYFNEHFINLSIDMEKGEGVEIAAKYKVTHYPTLIIADPKGDRITFTVGYIMPEDMLGFGKYGVQKSPKPAEVNN